MPEGPDKTERQVWGLALRALRKRSGLTIAEAAAAYEPKNYTPGDPDKGISSQRWQQIEGGELKFDDDQRRRLTRALGAGLEELDLERVRILGHRRAPRPSGAGERDSMPLAIPIWGRAEFDRDGWKVRNADVSEAAFDLRELQGPSLGITYMADEAMQPKVGPGRMVVFDRSRRPEPDKGCVVETVDGEMFPRIFLGDDAASVRVRALSRPEIETFARGDVRGVYAVRFWGD